MICAKQLLVSDPGKKGYIRLMGRIEEKGLLLSEYPLGVRPSQYNFPRRNRLISTWSDKLIAKSEAHFNKWIVNYPFYSNIHKEGVVFFFLVK